MLKYLIIPLADDAVSFCHYERKKDSERLITPEALKNAVFWAMKENLNIQFVYPEKKLPAEYEPIIESVDHTDIVSANCENEALKDSAEIIVFDSWTQIDSYPFKAGKSYVIRTSRKDLFAQSGLLNNVLKKADRLVVVIADADKFSDDDFHRYKNVLESLIPALAEEYGKGHTVHFNLLTDRMFLEKMNNCNAGSESITLAPDGKFYICPAFYMEGCGCSGDLASGPDIKNSQLYCLDHAPICRNCDAWQCRRCVWINKKVTLEVNTPGHEQCVVAHIERNASRNLLSQLRRLADYLPGKEIPQISYLDPFDEFLKDQL